MPDPKPKYVFLLPWPLAPGGGVNNVILGLSRAMHGRYSPVVVVTGWNRPPSGQIWMNLLPFELPLRNVAGFVIGFLPRLVRLRAITRRAVAVNPHFAHTEILPLVVLRKLRLCPKLILSVHGADMSDPLKASGWKRALYTWIFSSADLVVACSNALAATVRQVSPAANVVCAWNAALPPPEISGQRPMQSPYVVCVAAFVKKKGHDVLLQAFLRIARERPELRLVLIGGEGPERQAVVSTIDTLGLAQVVDLMVNVPHDEVWWWVRHAECLVLPSREEPFGIALLEAALVRTPVVATRVGGVPEFLTDGVHGLLCEPDRADQIADAILATLSDSVAAGKRTQAFYVRACEFTWDRTLERYRSEAGLP